MNKFFEKTGPMAIATRMRLLSEIMTKDAQKIYDLYNNNLKAKWYPVLFCMMQDEQINSVTAIANEVGQSHVSIVKIVKEMINENVIYEEKDIEDGRKTNLFFTSKGKVFATNLLLQHKDVSNVMNEMLNSSENNLWKALDEFETMIDEKSTYSRVIDEYKKRESDLIKIVPFTKTYSKDFEELNKEWINKCFKLEEKDKKVLENPQEEIISKGGFIYIALHENIVVGTCSLLKLSDEKYELSKMSVKKEFQGKGLGEKLGQKCLEKAKEINASSVLIETNTVLKEAVSLYEKLGFKSIDILDASYSRSNLHMVYKIKD